ncbi:MAG: hypothetical protein WDM76_12485 [Limisphaerales bacterium]
MNQNKISAALAATAVTNINTAITTIRTNLPFSSTSPRRNAQSLARAGDGSQAFLQASLNFAAQHPEALPATFNTAEFAKDGALAVPFAPIVAAIEQLHEDMQDTNLALNSDLFAQSLDVYAFAKANNRSGAYDTYIDSAKNRFAKTPRRPATGTPPAA